MKTVYVLVCEVDIEGVFLTEQDAWEYAKEYLKDYLDSCFVDQATLHGA